MPSPTQPSVLTRNERVDASVGRPASTDGSSSNSNAASRNGLTQGTAPEGGAGQAGRLLRRRWALCKASRCGVSPTQPRAPRRRAPSKRAIRPPIRRTWSARCPDRRSSTGGTDIYKAGRWHLQRLERPPNRSASSVRAVGTASCHAYIRGRQFWSWSCSHHSASCTASDHVPAPPHAAPTGPYVVIHVVCGLACYEEKRSFCVSAVPPPAPAMACIEIYVVSTTRLTAINLRWRWGLGAWDKNKKQLTSSENDAYRPAAPSTNFPSACFSNCLVIPSVTHSFSLSSTSIQSHYHAMRGTMALRPVHCCLKRRAGVVSTQEPLLPMGWLCRPRRNSLGSCSPARQRHVFCAMARSEPHPYGRHLRRIKG